MTGSFAGLPVQPRYLHGLIGFWPKRVLTDAQTVSSTDRVWSLCFIGIALFFFSKQTPLHLPFYITLNCEERVLNISLSEPSDLLVPQSKLWLCYSESKTRNIGHLSSLICIDFVGFRFLSLWRCSSFWWFSWIRNGFEALALPTR